MSSPTPTGKGQTSITGKVPTATGVELGDRLPAATLSVTDLKGMFGKARRTVSIAEMNAAIAKCGSAP